MKLTESIRMNLKEGKDEEQICVLCKKKFKGWGNDAWPLADGYCCDECNSTKVVPARIAQMYGSKNESSLKEDDEIFSGVSFEKNVPHGMRFKEYDFVDNGETLYWVTQEPFSKEQLNQFADAFYKTGIPHAAVTVRDFSSYNYEDDKSRNVLAYIDATENKVDSDGYWQEVINNGWENEIFECDKKLKEADENDPVLEKTVKVYDIDALVDKEINADSEEKYQPHTLHKAAIITKKDGTGCVVDYEAVGSSFDSIDDDITVSLSPKTEDENGKRSIYAMPTAQVKVKVSDLLKAPSQEMKVKDFFTKHNYNDRCEQNFNYVIPYLNEGNVNKLTNKTAKDFSNNIKYVDSLSTVSASQLLQLMKAEARILNHESDFIEILNNTINKLKEKDIK